MNLPPDEVHVWRIALDMADPLPEMVLAPLTPDELTAASRFVRPIHRRRYMVARAALRTLLGSYVQVEPRHLDLTYSASGKPMLPTPFHGKILEFNLSHSADLALCAMAWDHRVGIDVEEIRPDILSEELVAQVFSPAERDLWNRLPADTRLAAFFACWTRKEAVLKARGDGLSFELDQLTVSLSPDEPSRVLWIADDPDAATRWSLATLDIGSGWSASLVTEGSGLTVIVRPWLWTAKT